MSGSSKYEVPIGAIERQEKVLPLKEVERVYILQALEAFNWNRTRTAQALCIGVRLLRYRIQEYKKRGIFIPDSSYKPGMKHNFEKKYFENGV